MALSCSCDDFDKGDFDQWWEPGSNSQPPKGARCCECGEPLSGECETILHMEVYEPEGEPPLHPDDAPNPVSDNEAELMEAAHDAWLDEHGWDSECERYERVQSRDFRCERCSGLAESFTDLGYCLIAPGELIEAHGEYLALHGGKPRKWLPDAAGVLHPQPLREAA